MAVVFVVPGDLHLTSAGCDNHRAAEWMVQEVNDWIRPDFVQFIGDNVQHAAESEFRLFNDLTGRLRAPFEALVGDHDVYQDPDAVRFRRFVGKPYGATSRGGFRFLRLNTLEHQPLGISEQQMRWFRDEIDLAVGRGEQIVVFQHHYPFKVYEQFSGPGIDAWRETMQTRPIAAIFTGHTHYGQIANDGRNLAITTRSIGDPEGGPPGFTLAYLRGDDLAIAYRSIEDHGPIALITHPRELLLATGPRHIVTGADECRLRVWSRGEIVRAAARIDDGDWFVLGASSPDEWVCQLPGDRLAKGEHALVVEVDDASGNRAHNSITFLVDATGRYTPPPRCHPTVKATAYC